MEELHALEQGEPPLDPDIMQSVRLLADLPREAKPEDNIMTGSDLNALIASVRHEKAADFSVCDGMVSVKIE